jgi:tetratricopeptide (TPR) repeat protein
MKETSPTLYLAVLVVLLLTAAIFIGKEIYKTLGTERVLNNLRKKLQDKQGTAEDYYQLGSLYLDKKLFVQAVSLLNKALKVDDELPEEYQALIYNALGYAYFAQEQYDVAIRNYKDALKRNPEYVIALNNLGSVYEKKQMIPQAFEAYQKALGLDPNNTIAKNRSKSLEKRIV